MPRDQTIIHLPETALQPEMIPPPAIALQTKAVTRHAPGPGPSPDAPATATGTRRLRKGLPYARLLAALAVSSAIAIGPARASECRNVDIATELIDGTTYCASSILPPVGKNRYDAARLSYAGGTKDAWCEGKAGPGVGEWVTVEPRPALPVRTIIIANGYQKSAATFADNNRARRIRIVTANGTRLETMLADRPGEQRISLPGWERLGRIRVTILSVYPGRRHDDTCLTTVWPDIEEQRQLEWQQLQR